MTDFTEFPIPTKPFNPAQFAGADGRELELQTTSTHIQWRYVEEEGAAEWVDLVALSTLEGPQGDPGREVELRVSNDNLQWRRVGDASWQTIFDLSTLGGGGGDAPTNAVLYVVQQSGEALPARPSTSGPVLWYSWDDPTSQGAGLMQPFDQWYEIEEVAEPAVPDAFTTEQWSVADTGSGGEIEVTITELPNAYPISTDIEYRIDAGTAVSFGSVATASYTITGLTDDVEIAVQVRAVNDEGPGDWSDIKQVTPTEATIATSSVFWLDGANDDYGIGTMQTLHDESGDVVDVGDPVGFAANVI